MRLSLGLGFWKLIWNSSKLLWCNMNSFSLHFRALNSYAPLTSSWDMLFQLLTNLNTPLGRTLELPSLPHSEWQRDIHCLHLMFGSFATVSLAPTFGSSLGQDVFLLNVWSHKAMLARNTDSLTVYIRTFCKYNTDGWDSLPLGVTSCEGTAVAEYFSTPPRNVPKDNTEDLSNTE